MTRLVLIHGRSQASPAGSSAEQVRDHVEGIKRRWLGGLSKGLLLAGYSPIESAVFPFYADEFRDAIATHEAQGGSHPELELGPDADSFSRELQPVRQAKVDLLNDLLTQLHYDPRQELAYTHPELALKDDDLTGVGTQELGIDDLLRIPLLRAGLQYITRKTGVPAYVIERHLTDVAYYIAAEGMRERILDIVEEALTQEVPDGERVVIVGHSLGSIVAYDLLQSWDGKREVALFVTAGSPLGIPVVQTNLLGFQVGGLPEIPAPVRRGSGWINCYDVRDIVSIIHPLARVFTPKGEILDVRTDNSDKPHAIDFYLEDPDVANPIGRALEG